VVEHVSGGVRWQEVSQALLHADEQASELFGLQVCGSWCCMPLMRLVPCAHNHVLAASHAILLFFAAAGAMSAMRSGTWRVTAPGAGAALPAAAHAAHAAAAAAQQGETRAPAGAARTAAHLSAGAPHPLRALVAGAPHHLRALVAGAPHHLRAHAAGGSLPFDCCVMPPCRDCRPLQRPVGTGNVPGVYSSSIVGHGKHAPELCLFLCPAGVMTAGAGPHPATPMAGPLLLAAPAQTGTAAAAAVAARRLLLQVFRSC
jgi:hypothetical protein